MHRDCAGFTLVELVFVIILSGILAAYAVTQWPGDNELILPAQANSLVSDLRHSQALAMQWSQPLRFSVTTGSYTVSCVTASANAPCDSSPVIDPATGSAFSVTLPNGISLGTDASTDFDSLGRPVSGSTLLSNNPARSYTLSAGTSSVAITVQPITGFVEHTP
jgi:MSHA pilin protein MshC